MIIFAHSGISRFIPAYAGNSGFFCRARLSLSVHPRLRGELGNAAEAISSVVRFIPAYAGNSRRQFVKRLNISVHPRLRGELEDFTVTKSGCRGSSPLTRGTRKQRHRRVSRLRFIPAYAGNSAPQAGWAKCAAVHPRLRGELEWDMYTALVLAGSSPLTRGTHLKWLQHYTNRLTAKLLKNISKQEQSY